ncbi:unnamed protein product, partial [Ceratitis capitata]
SINVIGYEKQLNNCTKHFCDFPATRLLASTVLLLLVSKRAEIRKDVIKLIAVLMKTAAFEHTHSHITTNDELRYCQRIFI